MIARFCTSFFTKRACLLLLLAFTTAWLEAQKPSTLKSQGEQAFADQRWSEALDYLSRYQEIKPGDLEVLSRIGQAAYQLHQPELAKKYLGFVTGSGRNKDPFDWYYLAATHHGLMEWEPAIEQYKQFLRKTSSSHPYRAHVKDNLLRCMSGMKALPHSNVALVENMGSLVNSAGDELAPLPSINHSDRLYFSSSREGGTGGKRDDEGYEDLKRGQWPSDMLVTNRLPTGWEAPLPFNPLQNTAQYEVALDFTNKGQVLHFFRGNNLLAGTIHTDTAGISDEYTSEPLNVPGPLLPEIGDRCLVYVNDSMVVFASQREGGFGGLDLWASKRVQGGWMPAINLGPQINTAYDETTPFVAADGKTLYFSSNRTEGIGGLDVYRAVLNPESREWSMPVTMGIGINSPGEDAYFRLAASGELAYLASSRITDNVGGMDLYIVYFKEPVVEQQMQREFALFEELKVQEIATEAPSLVTAPLFYNSDKDLLKEGNTALLQSVLSIARRFPEIKLLITLHTDETGPMKFDLYAGIKRAELIGKYLTSNGVDPVRLVLRSAGPSFPLARNIINGENSSLGQSLNRRVEIKPIHISGTVPFEYRLNRPEIAEQLQAAGTARLDDQDQGLLFRVQMVVARQVITSDVLGLFSDVVLESVPGSGEYHYLAGAERRFAGAAALQKEVVAAGFQNATIVAYLNGIQLSKAEAIGLMKKYPDLASYIRS
jgi:outer membrane protein OmpA-like peptidoglycan-associated protein/tetratricopeptide (TPR) repeat protein